MTSPYKIIYSMSINDNYIKLLCILYLKKESSIYSIVSYLLTGYTINIQVIIIGRDICMFL